MIYMPPEQEFTCADCYYHRGSRATNFGAFGECRVGPPTVPSVVPRAMSYPLTADDLPACGHFRPLHPPEAPAAESKAEKIERLKREGSTDLAAFKRALEGR